MDVQAQIAKLKTGYRSERKDALYNLAVSGDDAALDAVIEVLEGGGRYRPFFLRCFGMKIERGYSRFDEKAALRAMGDCVNKRAFDYLKKSMSGEISETIGVKYLRTEWDDDTDSVPLGNRYQRDVYKVTKRLTYPNAAGNMAKRLSCTSVDGGTNRFHGLLHESMEKLQERLF